MPGLGWPGVSTRPLGTATCVLTSLSELCAPLGFHTVYVTQPLLLKRFARNVLTAVALGEQLFDELEPILPRVTSYRPNLLSDGDGALCAG